MHGAGCRATPLNHVGTMLLLALLGLEASQYATITVALAQVLVVANGGAGRSALGLACRSKMA